jgi:hypothetical protein
MAVWDGLINATVTGHVTRPHVQAQFKWESPKLQLWVYHAQSPSSLQDGHFEVNMPRSDRLSVLRGAWTFSINLMS